MNKFALSLAGVIAGSGVPAVASAEILAMFNYETK